MSGASDILDPVGVAQDDIDRSKHLIASTLDELTRHHSWLESYHRDERRRAERLRRQEALDRLELRRQRAAWLLRRFTVTSPRRDAFDRHVPGAETASLFCARRAPSHCAPPHGPPRAPGCLRRALRSLAASLVLDPANRPLPRPDRLRGRVDRLRLDSAHLGAAGIAFRKRLAAEFARASAQAAVLTHPMRKRASVAWLRTRLRSRRFAATGQARLATNWSRVRTATPILARRVVRRTAVASATLSAAAAKQSDRRRYLGSHTVEEAHARRCRNCLGRLVPVLHLGRSAGLAHLNGIRFVQDPRLGGIGHWSSGGAPPWSRLSRGDPGCRPCMEADGPSGPDSAV